MRKFELRRYSDGADISGASATISTASEDREFTLVYG